VQGIQEEYIRVYPAGNQYDADSTHVPLTPLPFKPGANNVLYQPPFAPSALLSNVAITAFMDTFTNLNNLLAKPHCATNHFK
jgi:hypothetical protein